MIAAMEWSPVHAGRSVTAPVKGAPPKPPVWHSSPGTEELHRDLDALVQSLSVFPVPRVIRLRDLGCRSPFWTALAVSRWTSASSALSRSTAPASRFAGGAHDRRLAALPR